MFDKIINIITTINTRKRIQTCCEQYWAM